MEIAFVVDTTGSMKDDINAVRDSLFDIVDSVIKKTDELSIRFAIVSYRDHPPQDKTYVTRLFDFSDDIKKVHRVISRLEPSEGGDTPEAVADALHDARSKLAWSPDSYKVLLLVGDAPPHGREYNSLSDDYFPDGCPDNLDPIEEVVSFKKAHGNTAFVFVCGCNPLVESSFKSIASAVAGGKYYSLREADELPAAILEILEGIGDLIEIDREVLSYYQSNDGTFDIGAAAAELKLPIRDLKVSISRLMELERIPRWPKGRPLEATQLGINIQMGRVPDALVSGKGFRYSLSIDNPSASAVTIRIIATLVSESGISEMTNERHEIAPRSSRNFGVNLVPMVSDEGKAKIKVTILHGEQLIADRVYNTRLYQN